MPKRLGRYEIIGELGKGAMGIVYEGRDPNIGRRVAIKTARRDVMEASGMADEMMERFLREAQAAGKLNHPNIITIFDAAEEDGMAYIAMEYLEGGDLSDMIVAKKRIPIEKIVDIGATICDALAVAHDQGVVHRDIKPANILMPTGKPLKVADFGIAHVSDSELTQEGALIGTPHYMSPEQFMGQSLDGASDLFSVGIILYELFTGEKPFTGEALSTVMHNVIKSAPVHPKEFNFNISDYVDAVVMKSLSKRPTDRYADARAMASALRESLKDNPDPAVLGVAVAGPPMDATVAGAAPPSADATVIATQTLDAAQEATEETTGAAASAPAAAHDAEATVGAAPASGAAQKPKTSLIVGGAIAAVVVIGAIVASMGGGGDDAPDTTPGDGGGRTQGNSGAQVTPQHYWNKFSGDFYLVSQETHDQWMIGDIEPDELFGKGKLVEVDLRLQKKGDPNKYQDELNYVSGTQVTLEETNYFESLVVKYRYGGGDWVVGQEMVATFAGQPFTADHTTIVEKK